MQRRKYSFFAAGSAAKLRGAVRVIASALLFALLCSLCACARDDRADIVKSFDTAQSAAAHCSFSTAPAYVPEGFVPTAFRTYYGIVFETEFSAEKTQERTATLRIVSAEYQVDNLSGYTETALSDVYTAKDGREFEIESRDGMYAAEWSEVFDGKDCNFSFVMRGDTLENYEIQLAALLRTLSDSRGNDSAANEASQS